MAESTITAPSEAKSPLTVDTAVGAFEGLLSRESDDEAPPPKAKNETQRNESRSATETAPEHHAPAQGDDEGGESDADAENAHVEGDEAEHDEPPAIDPRAIKHTVKVDGQEQDVDYDELLRGYSREASFTKKSQALAEQRKQFESEATSVRQERAAYADRLKALDEAIKAVTPVEPDWVELRQRMDPTEYIATYEAYKAHKAQADAVAAERQRAEALVADDQRKAVGEHVTAERAKLLEAVPAWKDAEVAKSERAEMRTLAESHYGFSAQELDALADHRVMRVLRDAMLQHRAVKAVQAAQPKLDKVKAATPNAAPAARPVSDLTRAKQSHAKRGTVDSAAKVFEHIL